MRAIRIAYVVILAGLLVVFATANRGLMTVNLLPEQLAPYAGGQWSMTMPAFVALFLAMVFGMLMGLIWEWLRESHLRAESRTRAHDLAQLQHEVGDLRRAHAKPRDEVLAILDDSAGRKPGAAGLPAPR